MMGPIGPPLEFERMTRLEIVADHRDAETLRTVLSEQCVGPVTVVEGVSQGSGMRSGCDAVRVVTAVPVDDALSVVDRLRSALSLRPPSVLVSEALVTAPPRTVAPGGGGVGWS